MLNWPVAQSRPPAPLYKALKSQHANGLFFSQYDLPLYRFVHRYSNRLQICLLAVCFEAFSTAVALVVVNSEIKRLQRTQRLGYVFAAIWTRNQLILPLDRSLAVVNVDFTNFTAPWNLGFLSDFFYYLGVWCLGWLITQLYYDDCFFCWHIFGVSYCLFYDITWHTFHVTSNCI